jgi:hypothetical protein
MLTKASWQGVELFEIEQSQEAHLSKKEMVRVTERLLFTVEIQLQNR